MNPIIIRQVIVDPEHISSLGVLRTGLQELRVRSCGLAHVHSVLLCDTGPGGGLEDLDLKTASTALVWESLILLG